jgi:hypothetical protein
MNHLHPRAGLFQSVQSSLIKPNQVIFSTTLPITPVSRHSEETAQSLHHSITPLSFGHLTLPSRV